MGGLSKVPEKFLDLLTDEKRAFAFLATTMPDGTPQVTPVWFNTENGVILINSALGRVKDRNMRESPKVALAIVDPQNPYRYLQIRGSIVEITTRDAREHINSLSKKYTGDAVYGGPSTEQRVIYKVQPEKVSGMG
jgi:PPOX class probable F420-dependent enzyme